MSGLNSPSGADASVQSNEKGDPVSTFVEQLLFLFVKKTEFDLDFFHSQSTYSIEDSSHELRCTKKKER